MEIEIFKRGGRLQVECNAFENKFTVSLKIVKNQSTYQEW